MTIRQSLRRARVSIAGTAAALAALFLLQAHTAHAAGVVGDGTPGSCTGNALQAAMDSGSGTITFNCGPNPKTILAGTHQVDSGESYVIDGGLMVTLDGESLRRLFTVVNGGTLTLQHISLVRGGAGSGNGGIVRNESGGKVTLRYASVTGSGAEVNQGGAISNAGELIIEKSFFMDNQARFAGGALYNGGTATILDTQMLSNDAIHPTLNTGDGGAIYNAGTLTLSNSTLFANRAKRSGGGIFALSGSLIATNSTIVENTAGADGQGGGIHVGPSANVALLNLTIVRNNADTGGGLWVSGAVAITNTIIADSSNSADNGTTSLNCDNNGALITSGGNNVIGDNTCVNGLNPTDQRSTDPKLSFINDNGGYTLTLMPLVGSPVIDKGSDAACPERDQRGFTRPAFAQCDVGAVEFSLLVFLPLIDAE